MSRENKYDDPTFFDAYSHFPRSVEGLKAAGEWPALEKMLPDFAGKRVLDIGCGFGWHCFYAADKGADRVLGTDISEKMLDVAREKLADWRLENPEGGVIEFQRAAMEDLDFAPGSFEVVISSLAFHYTEDLDALFGRIAGFLVPGGDFVFSMEHPVFTAYGTQEWIYDGEGKPLHWPVDRYFREGKRDASFLGEGVVKYHHTLDSIFTGLLHNGFAIRGVTEPQPPVELVESVPGMANELRRPMMLLVAARKEG